MGGGGKGVYGAVQVLFWPASASAQHTWAEGAMSFRAIGWSCKENSDKDGVPSDIIP